VYISQLVSVLRMRTFQSEANYWQKSWNNESRSKSSFRKVYGCYNDLVCNYKLLVYWSVC
jgi:hypothetical protein